MDLLGSILGSMTKPPSASEKEREERKKAKEMAKKMEEKQREHAKQFREKMEEKIARFLKSDGERCLVLEPMNKIDRSLVHDVAEVAGVVAHSFGEEDVDRHAVLWKKEDGPCDDELACLRSGKAWDPDENEREKREKLKQDILDDQERRESRKNLKKFTPRTNYQDKYQHLIGADAIRQNPVKESFGLVSMEEKKDRRTVEQVQADIRAAKKRQVGGPGEAEPKRAKTS